MIVAVGLVVVAAMIFHLVFGGFFTGRLVARSISINKFNFVPLCLLSALIGALIFSGMYSIMAWIDWWEASSLDSSVTDIQFHAVNMKYILVMPFVWWIVTCPIGFYSTRKQTS